MDSPRLHGEEVIDYFLINQKYGQGLGLVGDNIKVLECDGNFLKATLFPLRAKINPQFYDNHFTGGVL